MPLKLSIGLSRKAGEANYGSRGATVGLELEVDANLVHQPQRLRKRIAYLFQLARQSVDRELAQAGSGAGAPVNGQAEPAARSTTTNQVRALYAIANDHQIDLAAELANRFGVERPEELSLQDASQLIDMLKQSVVDVDHA
jgi:hypothetical protein